MAWSIKRNLLISEASLRQSRGIYDLIKLSQSGFSKDYYLVNNSDSIEYGGNTYEPYPFRITPNSRKDQTGASLVLANLVTEIHQELENALDYPNENIILEWQQVSIERSRGRLITGDIKSSETFRLISPKATKEAITCGLDIKNSLNINFGRQTFNSNDFPNIYL